MRRALDVLGTLLLLNAACAAAGWQEAPGADSQEEEAASKLSAGTFAGLELRGIGPALMSGRISDLAVDPTHRSTWYATAACGGVWKTVNAGTTWKPIFDGQRSYSIGCVSLDPENPQVVWIGTGENNSQRSVGWGDGVHKSLDGGQSWESKGLAASAHVGRILIDPRATDTVYVAAQGPLWSPGGDRGLYKSTDGGESWELVLEISENTGVTDVLMDPRDSQVLYAASWQRRRHVGILLAGGPESALHKSTDGGKSWRKLERGLPSGDIGRIGLAISPIDPDVIYATVETSGEGRGFYRSADRGESWEKRSDYYNGSGQYYGEIFADPHRFDCVWAMDVRLHVSEDGGKSFRSVSSDSKHVDNHALAFDPDDEDHLLIGCDGGIYETFDRCRTYRFVANLPLTQFYRLGLDDDFPFYNVYGGTQDNATQGGPVRTDNRHGIRNSDWFLVRGGDGFQPRIEPGNPDILYGQSQHGGLVRFDRRSGERVDIVPQPEPGEESERWHWNSPLIISPHSPTRLYFAGRRLFRSDDRGGSWRPVSPDLARCIDRNELEVMGRSWSVDAVSRNDSSSAYGVIVSLDESPLVEGLLYAGTDDGLIQVSEDGGESWRRIDSFPGVPELAYSADVLASRFDPDTVFALFENHKRGDFAPYALKSADRGRSWVSIAGDLPEDQLAWSIVQDHEKEDLLFLSTEFGVFFTVDGGQRWIQLEGGIPTIAVRDLEIQRRESDLVCASFGRGFWVLDDYSPLRRISAELLETEAALFEPRRTWWYVEADPLGWREKGSQGDAFYTAPNPPFGAVFTYYLNEGLKTRKERRQEAEKKLVDAGEPIPRPSWEELRAEDLEEDPAILLRVTDADGEVVRTVTGPKGAGLHRVAWNLRFPAFLPATLGEREGSWGPPPDGPLAVPGTYSVSLLRSLDGELENLAGPVSFEVVPLGRAALPAADSAELHAFQRRLGRLQRAVEGAGRSVAEASSELALVRRAIDETPGVDPALAEEARSLERRLQELREALAGDPTRSRRNEPSPPSIQRRVRRAVNGFRSTSAPTATQRRAYEIAAAEFEPFLEELRTFVEIDLRRLEEELEQADAPWTPGRGVPRWRRE